MKKLRLRKAKKCVDHHKEESSRDRGQTALDPQIYTSSTKVYFFIIEIASINSNIKMWILNLYFEVGLFKNSMKFKLC